MQSRSASSLFPRPAPACAPAASIPLRRGVWLPDSPRGTSGQALRPATVAGQPLREALRGLLAMLQRARALNSRAL